MSDFDVLAAALGCKSCEISRIGRSLLVQDGYRTVFSVKDGAISVYGRLAPTDDYITDHDYSERDLADDVREYLADFYARDEKHREYYMGLSDDEAQLKMAHSDYLGGLHQFKIDKGYLK